MPIESDSNKLNELIDLLSEAMDANRVEWEETPDENEFRTVLNTGMIRLRHHIPIYAPISGQAYFSQPMIPESYSLTIMDKKNQMIDELRSEGKEQNARMASLWKKVRRIILDLDPSYNSLLGELRQLAGK